MTKKTYHVEVLTPCFCAGADQSKAEIRVPSIRGQLRWWFRALGGDREAETDVFGGVHGNAVASAVVTRVKRFERANDWKPPPRVDPNDPASYIWYFASRSGNGIRWTEQGNVPPGSRFQLELSASRVRTPSARHLDLYGLAVEAFLRFGCLGLRNTRGLGALAADEFNNEYREACERLLTPAGFATVWLERRFRGWPETLNHAGALLKFVLRQNYNVKQTQESPLGYSEGNTRQASAVRIRPVRASENDWRLLLYEAPHARVLAPRCRLPLPILTGLRSQILEFEIPSPGGGRQGKGRGPRGR